MNYYTYLFYAIRSRFHSFTFCDGGRIHVVILLFCYRCSKGKVPTLMLDFRTVHDCPFEFHRGCDARNDQGKNGSRGISAYAQYDVSCIIWIGRASVEPGRTKPIH